MKRARLPDGPRRPIDLAKFKVPHPGVYTFHDCFCDYSRERLIAKGKDSRRAWIGFNNFFEVVSPQQPVIALEEDQINRFVDLRMQSVESRLTPRRELSIIAAAVRYAHRRNRIKEVPYIELPDGPMKRRRPLSEAEFKIVMRQAMSPRLRKFYRVAYYTGHRSEAIEELTWDRVDFERCTLDFIVPGKVLPSNKRRNGEFPIPDEFLPILMGWKELARDEFVIGAGGSTYPEAVKVVREKAGLTDPSLVPRHCMRKMFATQLFMKRADPELVGDLLKDNPAMLRKHYVQFTDAKRREVANLRVGR